MGSYKEHIYRAKLNERAERFVEMAENMKESVKKSDEEGILFGIDERNMLSIAYKNNVWMKRTSWRIYSKSLQDAIAADPENHEHIEINKEYKKKLEDEIHAVCDELLSLLDDYLLRKESYAPDAKVFFMKMKGDYLRYKAEIAVENDLKHLTELGYDTYQKAAVLAESKLTKTNPTRLGLYLNFSVFYFEILKDPKRAIEMGKKAFDDAISELEMLTDDGYKDSTLIMQLLRNNLSVWTTECTSDANS